MDFTHRDLRTVGKRVFRLGLAANYGIDEAGIRGAFDRGVNYVFFTPRGSMAKPLREHLARDRDKLVVACGPTVGWFGSSVRRSAERTLKKLGTDYLDVFQLNWLGVGAAWNDGTLKELRHLKESGKVRALGVSIHDRERAGKLAEDSPLDLLMIRYNAAHPGAERDIFPRLAKRQPTIVAYTATSWRKLLRRPRGWDGKLPTAGDCYRFCLSSPHVDLVLCGPASTAQLDENLAALEHGPLTAEEDTWLRNFGQVVHG
ncbi:MAG: putative aldo/keto reductase [Deltaproteobacteria bacterium]|nr:putative aldo/keto reductase [Deltaproteobacteria bacterium]